MDHVALDDLLNRNVLVHSKVIDQGPPAMKLWYLCRALDTKGAGKATISIGRIREVLGVSETTAWRYYTDQRLFPKVINRDGLLTLYYRSLVRICVDLGIAHWGVSTELKVKELVNAKKLITLAEALSLQKKSRFKVLKEARAEAKKDKEQKKNPRSPAISDSKIERIFELSDSKKESISEISTGIMKLNGALLLCNEKWQKFGGSQFSVARNLGRSVRTVSRRLADFPRLKVAVTTPSTSHELNYHQFNDREEWTRNAGKYFLVEGKVFRRQPNLYRPTLELTTKRKRLNSLKHYFSINGKVDFTSSSAL